MPEIILSNISGMSDAAPVETLNSYNLSEREFLKDYVSNSRPCVIRGAVASWPASKRWTNKDYLTSLCGHHRVPFYLHENLDSVDKMKETESVKTFSEAIHEMHSEDVDIASLGGISI